MALQIECEITAGSGQRRQAFQDDQGEEAAKPLRKTMKKLAQIAHHEKYSERLGKENRKCGQRN
jgi:hypothetical protein